MITETNEKTASVDQILNEVTEVLAEVELKANMPQAKKVKITFETEIEKETGAGFKILIFKAGRKWMRAETNETTFNFEIKPRAAALAVEELKKALARVIKSAYDQLLNVKNTKVRLNEFSVKISFAIEKTSETTAGIEFIPITPNLSRSWKRKAVHTIEVEFSN